METAKGAFNVTLSFSYHKLIRKERGTEID
jgi:hypothetical protein